MRNADMKKYIRRIHNPAKRTYAERYAEWMLNSKPGESPPAISYSGLSYMAAQAVRIALADIYYAGAEEAK